MPSPDQSSDDPRTTVSEYVPVRVFISYSHDSEEHRQWVLELANRLRNEGVDCWIDRFDPDPSDGWPRWMEQQLAQAQFVLVVCTATYRRRFDGLETPDRGLGVNWEATLIAQAIYERRERPRFVPVIPDGLQGNVVPDPLGNRSRYQLPSQYDDLYRLLTNQPEVVPRPLGSLRQMPAVSEGTFLSEPVSAPAREVRASALRPESPMQNAIPSAGDLSRVIRVHVSSADDVRAEREVLDEVVSSINRTEGDAHGVHLEVFRWERDAVPQIGPGREEVLCGQSEPCPIYLGIVSATLGDGQTKREFDEALRRYQQAGEPWILIYFDDDARPGRTRDAARQWMDVIEFRERVEQQGVIGIYSGVRGKQDGFFERVSEHLRKLVHRLTPRSGSNPASQDLPDSTKYLQDLQEKNGWIDMHGLQIGDQRMHRFPIEELYMTLTATGADEPGRADRGKRAADRVERQLSAQRRVPLDRALRHDRLVVIGLPGAGKTTFLQRITYALSQTQLGEAPRAAEQRLGIRDRTFPVYVRIRELAEHIRKHDEDATAPPGDSAGWLPHFLGDVGKHRSWNLDADYFRQQLEDGRCTVLLDGLDEAPRRATRERMSRVIRDVTSAYAGCRFVVTSRPVAYRGEVVLPDFAHADIDPLSDEAVATFLSRWCAAVYPDSEGSARVHCDALLGAVRGRVEIRRMARNPVMLTALAVVHWNERRLPEQRADLIFLTVTDFGEGRFIA